jgi:hypothetical protein
MILALPTLAHAEVKTPSAKFASTNIRITNSNDRRITILKNYLEDRNSPMSESAHTFVEMAEENDLDWKFVAAIAGVESSYGKHIPYNSYNGWGWGVYGDNVIRFSSWDEAITTISQTLKRKYVDNGATDVYSIGRIYAADPKWATKVLHFMNDIAAYEKNYSDKRLSISI